MEEMEEIKKSSECKNCDKRDMDRWAYGAQRSNKLEKVWKERFKDRLKCNAKIQADDYGHWDRYEQCIEQTYD